MIKLVDIQPHHIPHMYNWEKDVDIQWKAGVESVRSYERFLAVYQAYFRGESPHLYLKAIEVDGKLVGKIELFMTFYQAFIGIILAEQRRKGIGSNALNLFLLDVRRTKKVKVVKAEVYQDNRESLAFFKKNGFHATGEVIEEMFRQSKRQLILLEKYI